MKENNLVDMQESRFEKIIEKCFNQEIEMYNFYQEILTAKLYYLTKHVDVPRYDENGNIIVSLISLKDSYDNILFPIFSSYEKIFNMKWTDIDICSQTGLNILTKFNTSNFVLNPASKFSKIIDVNEVKNILNGSYLPITKDVEFDSKTQFEFYQPKKFPKKFASIMSRVMQNNPEIKKAYLAYVVDKNSENGFRVMIVINSSCDLNNLTPKIFNALKNYNLLSKDLSIIDLVCWNNLSGSILTYFQSLKPFYANEIG